jgi:hypothetical protein
VLVEHHDRGPDQGDPVEIGSPDCEDPRKIAELAFQAEVTEFDEPGGRMDHYTSAWAAWFHLDLAAT